MSNPEDYIVGWICALSTENVASQAFLDERHEAPEYVSPHDNNDYTLGKVGRHNVVIAVLPEGEYGIASAACVARDMLHSFPNVRIGLMVGIGGGAPSSKHDIRLGDIVVSVPRDGKGGVLQYDFGKTIQDQAFRSTGFLNQPPTVLRAAVAGLKAQYESEGHQFEEAISSILEKKPRLRQKYKRPDSNTDRLYQATVTHPLDEASCAMACGDDLSCLVPRSERTENDDNPTIHYGLIASANQLMKDALVRDRLIAEQDVLCFEMEAAGLINHFPCLVIRGICDYSDTHKNKEWQGYAAMVAAGYAKDLLYRIPPSRVEAEKRIVNILSDVLENTTTTKEQVTRIRSKLDADEDLVILDWLTPIDYGPQQSDYLKRRQVGTGQWLLDSGKFQAWLETNKQTLFCPGIPGAGKTILTSIVVDDLISRFQNNLEVGIAFIYCNFRRRDEQTIEDLLASLLKQLSQGQPSLPDTVKTLYARHQVKRTRPSSSEISEALLSVAALYSRIFIIVDALDECQASDDCRAKLLEELLSLQEKCEANVFATSRNIPEITKKFAGSASLEIRASSEDVGAYIDSHIFKLPAFVLRSLGMQKEIRTEIISAVDGMFLLAQLYLGALEDKMTSKDMKIALKHLRKQERKASESEKVEILAQAYDQAMERIKGQKKGFRQLAEKVLPWITYAKRPLTTSELQHALAVEVGKYKLDEENLPDVEDIVSVCAGLVTVDDETRVIRLVHYTTQEYFERAESQWFPNANTSILITCATYLLFDDFKSGFCKTDRTFEQRLQLYEFYDYAARNWGHHARQAMTYIPEVMKFLKTKENVYASSQALLVIKQKLTDSYYSQVYPKQMTGLHLAAYFGIEEAVESLLNDLIPVDLKDSFGETPLWWAARNGHKAVVKLLLQKDAEVDSKELHSSQTPLWWAARNGHTAVVKLLLKRGADVDSKDSGHTPLSMAVRHGNDAVVGLLLENGADCNMKSRGQAPLYWAAQDGHEVIVDLLLKKGAEVDCENFGHTPLSIAVRRQHVTVVKLLLAKGADCNSDRCLHPPLSEAAANGENAVVELLLKAGADIKPKGSSQTPLSWAARNGHEATVKLLLEKGADIDSVDRFHSLTPLSYAARNGDNVIVELLLQNGANISHKSYGQTPLSWAAQNGHEATVQLLLEQGANVDSKDKYYSQTPLAWAAQNGHEAIVKLLLDKGANVHSKYYGKTPLSRAAENGHSAIVQLLNEKGAQVDLKSGSGLTLP